MSGHFYSGETLLSRMAGKSERDFIVECIEDRRISVSKLVKCSGYSRTTIKKIYEKIKTGGELSKKHALFASNIKQCLAIIAGSIYSNPVDYEGFGMLSKELKVCESGLCDEQVELTKSVFFSRDLIVTDLVRELGKGRHWFYLQKQNAMLGCQTPIRCKNWKDIHDVYYRLKSSR